MLGNFKLGKNTNKISKNILKVGVLGGMGPKTGYDFDAIFKALFQMIPFNKDDEHPDYCFWSPASMERRDYFLKNFVCKLNEINSTGVVKDKNYLKDCLQIADLVSSEKNPLREIVNYISEFKLKKFNFILVPCNTFHYFHKALSEEFSKSGDFDIFNMIEIVSESVKSLNEKNILKGNNKIEKIGLLATSATIENKIYHGILEAAGFTVITGNQQLLRNIDELINLVKVNKTNSIKAKELLEEAVKILEQQGAQCVILGCTELPLIVRRQSINSSVELIDSTLELAKSAALRVCKELKPESFELFREKIADFCFSKEPDAYELINPTEEIVDSKITYENHTVFFKFKDRYSNFEIEYEKISSNKIHLEKELCKFRSKL
jgi:aspartate racemase